MPYFSNAEIKSRPEGYEPAQVLEGWMIAPGARIADGHLFHDNGEILRALEWQPLA
jgi:hypothetical protein